MVLVFCAKKYADDVATADVVVIFGVDCNATAADDDDEKDKLLKVGAKMLEGAAGAKRYAIGSLSNVPSVGDEASVVARVVDATVGVDVEATTAVVCGVVVEA